MDFFSAAAQDGDEPPPLVVNNDFKPFNAAVHNTPLTPPIMPHSPMASMSLGSTKTGSNFVPVKPAALPAYLDDPQTLVVDIRPHAAFTDARLPRALSLSVPSTLLKRPLFSLDRLADMLPSSAARNRFNAFHDSARILVYDADASAIPDSSNIHGLLRKFRAAHFTGELAWLCGGFQSVWREQRHLIDTKPPLHDDDDPDDAGSEPNASSPILRTRKLPMTAFSLSSTTIHITSPLRPSVTNPFFDAIRQNVELPHGITERIPLRLPHRVRRRINDLPFPWLREIARRADRAPRTHHLRTHMPMHQLQLPHPPHQHHVPSAYNRPAGPSSFSSSSSSSSSDSDAGPSAAVVDEGTDALAMQFYRIELAEQRRLMGVMEHHSKESGHPPVTEFLPGRNFPFSITAGVEKGAKNRYRHIWPFEHARVKLCQGGEGKGKERAMEVDDYVNASYVQPLGTARRYIATQGPLEATFDDFWRLAWQQDVHVIVMLTQEVEGAMVKCGTYWADTGTRERDFGMLHLTLLSKVGLPGNVDLMHEEPAPPPSGLGFGFGLGLGFGSTHTAGTSRTTKPKRRITTIKRTFRLEHRGYPNSRPREVVQLQFLDWPDMNVPEDARGLLGLVREVERAVEETGFVSPVIEEGERMGEGDVDPISGVAWHAVDGKRPVLLHCSAGVGRTGGFIALDAVLDAIRREFREKMERERRERQMEIERENMDVNGRCSGDAVMIPLPVSGEPSPTGIESGAEGLVRSIVVPLPIPNELQVNDTSMVVDGDAQRTQHSAENVESPVESLSLDTSPPPTSSPLLSLPFLAAPEDGTRQSKKYPLTALKMNIPSSPMSMSSPSTSASTSGSIFPSFSDSDRDAYRLRGGSTARESPLATSVSGESMDGERDGRYTKGMMSEEQQLGRGQNMRFRTISEPYSQAHSRFQLSLGTGMSLGSSPLARSSEQSAVVSLTGASAAFPFAQTQQQQGSPNSERPNHRPLSRSSPPIISTHVTEPAPMRPPLLTADYKQPRMLDRTPVTPVELSRFEDPIWEVLLDMREQRMSLCQSLRQYVFVHQAIIEGALKIVDEERERGRKEEGKAKGVREVNGDDDMSRGRQRGRRGDGLFPIGSGGTSMIEGNVPFSVSPEPIQRPSSTSRPSLSLPQVLSLPQMPQMQKFNSTSTVSGFSSDSGSAASSTMKRGASPTELLKEGKKGEVLLSKRPSIKRKPREPNSSLKVETEGGNCVTSGVLETVPPSPRTF